MSALAPSFFESIILILAGKEDMHESFDESKRKSNEQELVQSKGKSHS